MKYNDNTPPWMKWVVLPIVAALFACASGCALLKPMAGGAAGAGLGFAVGGPVGAVVGAGVGAGGGANWAETERVERQVTELKADLAAREALLTQYEIDRKANEAIAKHNATLPPEAPKVPPIVDRPIGPPGPIGTDKSFWQETPFESVKRWFGGLF